MTESQPLRFVALAGERDAPPRPRHLTHRGVVEAEGLLFPAALLDDAESRRRILALWAPGVAVYRTRLGRVVALPAPERMVCENAPGMPLLRSAEMLLAAPIAPADLARLPHSVLCLVAVEDGVVTSIPLGEQEREDPAGWLDLSAWRPVEVASLGAPPAPPVLVTDPPKFAIRERLAGVPAESAMRADAVEALRRALAVGAEPRSGLPTGPRALAARALQGLAALLRGPGAGRAAARPAGSGVSMAPASDRPPDSGALQKLADRMNELAARMLVSSGMAAVIGRKQAEYMERMMRMFEQGMLDEALRHAIGLFELDEIGSRRSPMLHTPTPRSDLTIAAGAKTPRSSLTTDSGLFGQLKALYRNAFTQLAADGKIDEAAFVLAELLNAHEEAVAFLEKHDRVQLAAEMAEARRLAPGLVVRLWFLAGDRDRATRLAWKHGAFADAVDRMQRVDAQRARELRRLWAVELARSGAYAAAVDVLWTDIELRGEAIDWIDLAVAVGGESAGRMLGHKLALLSARDPSVRDAIVALLSDERAETGWERRGLLSSLAHQPAPEGAAPLYRLAARAALRDAGAELPAIVNAAEFGRLIAQAADGALRTDLPPLPTVQKPALADAAEALCIDLASADRGARPLLDAVLLPGGRTVVALGEAGVRLLGPDGRTVVHWDYPAQALVVSDQGDRVIALVRRGDVWQMTRIDLISRRAAPWRDAALDAFASSYDGALWFVSAGSALIAIDAGADGFDAIWREPQIEGRVVSMTRSPAQCSILVLGVAQADAFGRPEAGEISLERRTYALPEIVLRDRTQLAPPALQPSGATGAAMSIRADGQPIYTLVGNPQPGSAAGDTATAGQSYRLLVLDPRVGTLYEEPLAEPAEPMPAACRDTWIVCSTRSRAGIQCRLLDHKSWRVRARVALAGAGGVSARLHGGRLTIADDLGRLVALDLATGAIVRNLRIR
ncbi:MAG TPA: bpX6 domain-containing protein [Chthonomonadaceae bacterium]|nr:bpX6 domain-containing protein [Chthonomonadaceae bacterium]